MSTCDWIQRFRDDPDYGHLRFKRMVSGYPPHDMDADLVDLVSPEVLLTPEPHRLPLFIGSQFGINPRLESLPTPYVGVMTLAILGKSLLSGSVAGLSIYEVEIEQEGVITNRRKIRHFQNQLE